ncbi:phasin family protein [Sphingomonas sp.]|uniref:phasin family protein n=1 Tax=Sphingomonas sp. TaxID=28214 RepID=UPI00286CCC11|nr:phasin family protein [Sphingomonas sp.]
MANDTIIANTEPTTDKAVEAVTAPAKAVAAKVEKIAAKPVRKARAVVAKRRSRKAPAKLNATVKKINKRAVKSTKRIAKATIAAVTTQIERNSPMAYDFTKMFAGFELPAVDRFQTIFAGAGERGQDLVRKSQEAASEMTEIAKANLEAITEAGRIAATGVRSLGQDALASSRDGFEQASTSLKTLADAKSPTEFFQLQSELARTSFDRLVAEGSKFTEAMVKLAGEAVQPLSNRASINAERINELAA